MDDYNPACIILIMAHRLRIIAKHPLWTNYAILIATFLFSCQSTPTPPPQTSLLLYRFNSSALVEYSADFEPVEEMPFSIPLSCGINNTFPAPIGRYLVIELNCPNGQTVLFLDTESGTTTQPVTDSDSHFLAWTSDGNAAYLKVDALGSPRVIRAYPDGAVDPIAISEFTYDLAAKPDSSDFTYTFSRGLGQGSELWLAQNDARSMKQLYADLYNYISFARFSPDGKQIAFIKIPDSQTPFTVGELWLIPSTADFAASTQGGKFLAYADAGHGYAANWSPDGRQIAFVVRENPEDAHADQSSEALISNIYIVDVESGELTQVTSFTGGRVETPVWSPDGNTLAFQVVINGRMNVSIADATTATTGEIQPFETESACCPAWMRE
jgi:Tol biopolymer transport system component